MLRLHIHSNQMGKYWLDFNSKEEAQAYKDEVYKSQHWGRPAWTEIKIIEPEQLDEKTGEVIKPAVTEVIKHAAEYEIVEEDIKAEVEAKEKKKKDKETLKLEAESLLKKSGSLTLAEVSKILRAHLGE